MGICEGILNLDHLVSFEPDQLHPEVLGIDLGPVSDCLIHVDLWDMSLAIFEKYFRLG